MRILGQRGFTFMEVTIVMVLAGVVTLGLVGFYLNSQALWIDGSAQALAQRDGTTLVESISAKTRGAATAGVFPMPPDGLNHQLILWDGNGDEICQFLWDASDSLVHQHEGGADKGPIVPSIVERFSLSVDPTLPLVHLDSLRVRSSAGRRVALSSAFALHNHP